MHFVWYRSPMVRMALMVAVWFVGMSAVVGGRTAEPVTFLVFPLENLTRAAATQWIGDGIMISVSDQLQIPGVEVIGYDERIRMVEEADLPPNVLLSRASVIRIAQQAAVDYLVQGRLSGGPENLQVQMQLLDMKSMRLAPEIAVSGPAATLPQIENQLAWEILLQAGLKEAVSREEHSKRTRLIPNSAFGEFVRSLGPIDANSRLKLLLKAVEGAPDFPEAHFRLGRIYYQQKDCARAIRHLERAEVNARSVVETRFIMGTCYCKVGALAQGIQEYSSIVPYSKSVELLNNLAVAHLKQEDYASAEKYLVQARSAARTDPVVSANTALLRYLQGDARLALTILEEGTRSNTSNGSLQFLTGMVLLAEGQMERAEAALTQARRLGIDVAKLRAQKPREWTQFLLSWGPPQ